MNDIFAQNYFILYPWNRFGPCERLPCPFNVNERILTDPKEIRRQKVGRQNLEFKATPRYQRLLKETADAASNAGGKSL